MSIIAGECCRGCGTFIPAGDDCLLCTRASCVRSETGATQAAGDYSRRDPNAANAAHPLPTPRTDAYWRPSFLAEGMVPADFARTLEREAAELRENLIAMTECAKNHDAARTKYLFEAAELRVAIAAWKREEDSWIEREADLRAHLDRLTGMKFSDRMHAALVSRAETAERQRDEARAAAFDEALQCYSPDDSATDWADKIRALKEKSNG